jgi:hypothetical protein
VRAAGVNPSDWKKRKGLMDGELPQAMGHEAAGVVDELGEGVADVAVGDRVFGCAEGAAQAELAVLSYCADPAVAPLAAGRLRRCRRGRRAPAAKGRSGRAARGRTAASSGRCRGSSAARASTEVVARQKTQAKTLNKNHRC